MNLRDRKTLFGYGLARMLDTPFWGLYTLIPFILYKDLGATPTQVAFLVTLRPLLSLLSIYWSSPIQGRPDTLLTNIRSARFLAYLPFFFFPFFATPSMFIFAYGFFMMLQVGTIPAWMEILNRNVPKEKREKVFSYIQAFGYMGGGLFPFIIGGMLDHYPGSYKWLFPIAALIGLSADFLIRKIPIDSEKSEKVPQPAFERLKFPWSKVLTLLKERKDYAKYQFGFMFVGSGLMIMQPALPVYFTDVLNLSYTELAVAVTLCKGIGFAIASPLWASRLNRTDIYYFSGVIALSLAVFPCFLFFATYHLIWLYIAYLFYGVAQAGQELMWNMSGPIFARNQESSLFTTANVMAMGLRGAFIPFLGSLAISYVSAPFTLVLGALFCFIAAIRFTQYGRQSINFLHN